MPADPRAPLNPQVKTLFDMMAAGRPTRVLQPGPLREGLGALGPLLNAGAPTVAAEREIQIPGPGGNVRARVFWPGDPKKGPYPVVVYFHGGGYVVMSPETHEKLTKQLCVGSRRGGGVGRLPALARAPLPRAARRLPRRLPLGARARGRARRRCGADRRRR